MELVTYYTSYLLQCFQALVHSQSISQCRGSRISNCIHSKTVEEYSRISTNSACYNRALCRSGFLLIAYLIVIIPNSLKITVVFSLQLLRNMLSNSVCSECYCCQTFTQQEQNLITIRPYSCSPGNRQYCKVPTSTSITVNST